MKIDLNNYFPNYQLIDCGNGKKLEKFNNIVLIRPEITATGNSQLSIKEWKNIANAEFIETSKNQGYWDILKNFKQTWFINYQNEQININAELRLTNSKHIGIFPEQVLNWLFIKNISENYPDMNFLNLFGYTGLTSIAAARFSKSVTHIDSIKKVVDWTKINAKNSGIDNIRLICEDAPKFVEREIKRTAKPPTNLNNKYDAVILDPPPIGVGANNEKWILNKMLDKLLQNIALILKEKSFVIMNLYSHSLNKNYVNEIIHKNFPKHKVKLNEEVFSLSKYGNTISHSTFIHLEN
ncbi:MAG: class I SAM-dependent methyltransferase [Bacteroidales bacterium]|nr:class I SAM-dependent methyltransferase [Bacteroidales bacterium]